MPESKKIIAITADHGGFALKGVIKPYLEGLGYQVVDLGTHSADRTDYPDYAFALVEALRAKKAEVGIAICGTGIGMSIALNRFADIRAARCNDVTSAMLARQHNDANVLCLGGRVTGNKTALDCVDAFLIADFEGGRHAERNKKVSSCGTK